MSEVTAEEIACLTFLRVQDEEKFILTYGQQQISRQGLSGVTKILILPVPITCNRSTKSANEYLLRSLLKKSQDRKVKFSAVPQKPLASKEFRASALHCGTWSYSGNELIFVPYFIKSCPGTVKFGQRSLILNFNSEHRVEFLYASTIGITMESAPNLAITISLWEAPRSYFDVDSSQMRQRTPALDSSHLTVLGSCFVYRISLAASTGSESAHKIAGRMHSLQKAPGLPSIVFQQIDVHHPRKPFSHVQHELDTWLADGVNFPHWTLNFQLRALTSNGYLSAPQTSSILPAIQMISRLSDPKMTIATVLRFRSQVPYAGPETDGNGLKATVIFDLLYKAEAYVKTSNDNILEEETYKKRSEDMAMIHRITITPAGVYLYGPEPEPMNRM